MKKFISIIIISALALFSVLLTKPAVGQTQPTQLNFAAISDYGVNDSYEASVAALVAGWNPDIIITMGDNYTAPSGVDNSQKYDLTTGKYYCNFIKDITTAGTFCPQGQASVNRFFPAVGDHDYSDGGTTANLPTTYTAYFNLPGNGYTSSSDNERYYDFVSGPVHFFVLNSNNHEAAPGEEPDGTDSTSVQAMWLRAQLAASTSTWNIVYFHEPPYSSGTKHGSNPTMQWPFAQWGADAVLSGHEHGYERIMRDGIVYFVNGLGGDWYYPFSDNLVAGSAFHYNASHGAQHIVATASSLTFEFYSVDNGGTLLDSYTLTTPHNTATPTAPFNTTAWLSPGRQSASSTTVYGDNDGFELNPSNTLAADGLFAVDMDSGTSTSASCADYGKDRHRFYNYGISVPTGAIIQGLQVRLDALADSTLGAPRMCVSISPDNGQTWSSWRNTATLTTTETTYLFGNSNDTWGLSLTPSALTNANFQLRVLDTSTDPARDFSLDWVAVNVSYNMGPSTATLTATDTSSLPIATDTSTATEFPPAPSPTASSTSLPPSATSTATDTSLPPTPTSTATSLPPTETSTSTATNTPLPTSTNTSLPPTSTFTSTATYTLPAPTATNTALPATATFTQTATNTSSPTMTPTSTATNTPLPPTAAPTSTGTNTIPPTATASAIATPTVTPTINPTQTGLELPQLAGSWQVIMTFSGGLSGRFQSVEINSNSEITTIDQRANLHTTHLLSQDDITRLAGLLTDSRYQPASGSRFTCADCFVYTLKIITSGQKFQVQLDDISLPPSGLQPIFSFLSGFLPQP